MQNYFVKLRNLEKKVIRNFGERNDSFGGKVTQKSVTSEIFLDSLNNFLKKWGNASLSQRGWTPLGIKSVKLANALSFYLFQRFIGNQADQFKQQYL